ncbi:hypothetical protein ZMO02_14190 [Zymomonas mobilis subsp. pomaceae]|nr:hypothetical protein ZMO02_14190 [Zymomonas mobilis subsp. pomaceae]
MAQGQVEPVKSLSHAAVTAQKLLDEVGKAQFTSPDFRPGLVRHVVMFRFNQQTTAVERKKVTEHFLALATLSRRPDGRSVVVSIETGAQNSGENADLGLEQGYLVTFNSEGDRNYYVGQPLVKDPAFFDAAHEKFKQFAGPFLAEAVVFDFSVTSKKPA